jgi:drug/metabolite transporter (DMT)-like permease
MFTEASVRVGSLTVNVTRMILAIFYISLTIIIFNLGFVLSQSQIIFLAFSGIAGLVIGDSFLFKSFQYLGPRISMLFMSLAPPTGAILAYLFLDEGLSLLGILGIGITILGISIVVLQRSKKTVDVHHLSKIGVLFAIIAAMGQGTGLVLAKAAFNIGEIHGLVANFYRFSTAELILLPLVIFSPRFKNPIKSYSLNKKAFGFTAVGSVTGPFMGSTLSLVAVANAEVGIASTIMATVPIIMLPIAKFYYKEKLSLLSILGAVIAVVGVAILFLR